MLGEEKQEIRRNKNEKKKRKRGKKLNISKTKYNKTNK